MHKHAKYLLAIFLILASLCSCTREKDFARFVNPMVGTAYTGHTFPGAAFPFGSMQPGPQTGNYDWEHCSGYNHDDSQIWGFGQNHLNGTGVPDLGDISMMPFSEKYDPDFRSAWDKESETAEPGYYKVSLTDNKVDVELTATSHIAMHRYSFNGSKSGIFIDFQYAQTSSREQYESRVIESEVHFSDASEIFGHLSVSGWVNRQIYFLVALSTPFCDTLRVQGAPENEAPKYVITFPDSTREVMAKVAISTVSIEEAKANMAEEVPSWDFDAVRSAARSEWNKYFALMQCRGSEDQMKNFYTAFYHLLIQPNNIADVSGRYRGADGQVHEGSNGVHFSTLSLWDTFRAAHPFYALMLPDKDALFVNSMLEQCDEQGFLPIWALWGQENYCMIGNHAVPAVVDACVKDLPGIDKERAYQAVKKSLTVPHYRSDWAVYDKYGYYPFDIVKNESVSMTLECGYDDYCASVLAKELGHEEDYEFFSKRSQYYKNLFDPSSGLMRGKDSNGCWRTPFDKFSLSHGSTSGGDYTEGNAWQYTWHVLQDIDGLASLMGGKERFLRKLDSLFILDTRAKATGFVGDVTGLIGQYAHGNEPSHHVVYLYSLCGERDRTAELVREIFDKFYIPKPDGLCGNDDCGQMSAWYIFSAMGFYPVSSVSGEYVIGAPQIPYIKISLPNGKVLEIEADNLSEANKYIKEIKLNGKSLDNIITYDQIMDGGRLEYVMTDARQSS